MNPVLIIGAGLGGCTLAQTLHRAHIPYKIYERDSAASQRSQGYRIRIHETGLDALKESIPPSVYKRFEDTCAKSEIGPQDFIRTNAITGTRNEPSEASIRQGRPRGPANMMVSLPADRTVMRNSLLLDLSPPIYDKSFTSYTIHDSGVVAHFLDGTSSVEGSLLVAADGIHSKVARQLIGEAAAPLATGTWMIYGKTPLDAKVGEKLLSRIQHGITMIEDKSRDIMITAFMEAMRFDKVPDVDMPQDYIYWVLSADKEVINLPDDHLRGLKGEEAALIARKLTANWNERIRAVFEHLNVADTALLRMTSSDPRALPQWPSNPRVTVLGDAIHQMPPTGGSGANTALRDAAILGRLLAEQLAGGTAREEELERRLKNAVAEYEMQMLDYAQGIVRRSYSAAVKAFGVKPIPGIEP